MNVEIVEHQRAARDASPQSAQPRNGHLSLSGEPCEA